MPIVTVSVDTAQTRRAFAQLKSKFPAACARALNKTVDAAKVQAVRSIAANLGLREERIRPNIIVLHTRPEDLTSTIYAAKIAPGVMAFRARADRLGKIPLYEFNARGPIPSRGKGGGVTYQLPTGRGRAPHAFITTVRAGKYGATHTGVFQRIPGTQMKSAPFSRRLGRQVKRQEIFQLYGPSIPHVYANKAISDALMKSGAENLAKNLQQEIEPLLKRG